MSFRGPGLYEFLTEAELQQYYNHFKNDLKVGTTARGRIVNKIRDVKA